MLDKREAPESPEGSFFSDRALIQGSLVDASAEFWLASAELLGKDGSEPSTIIQYFRHDGGYVDLQDADPESYKGESVHTLVFQARDICSFVWQLTQTHSEGRSVHGLTVGKRLQGKTAKLDSQGRCRSIAEMEPCVAEGIAREIFTVVTAGITIERVGRVKQAREKALEEQLTFDLKSKNKIFGEIRKRKEESQEELVKKARFTRTAMFSFD